MTFDVTKFTHDAFVRTVLSDPQIAHEFLSIHLPNDIKNIINFDFLELQPRSYINDVRKESIADVLYKTKIAEEDAYLYLLIEHQSTPSELMPFRMLKYTCNIIDKHLTTTKQKTIPLIYPIVIYHNERIYPFSTDIRDIVAAPRKLIDQYFLKPFQLIDLNQIADEEIKQHAKIGVMEFFLKHIYAKDILPYVKEMAGYMRRIIKIGGQEFLEIVIQYALVNGQFENPETFLEIVKNEISSEIGGNIMTGAELLINKGLKKGLEEGMQRGREEGMQKGKLEGKIEGKLESKLEIAKQLLLEGIGLDTITRVTGISLDQLMALQTE